MAMFRPFSFDAPPRQPSPACALDRTAASVEPKTIAAPQPRLPTPPPCSVNDLVRTLNQQNLRVVVDTPFSRPCEPLTPPSDDACDVAFPAEQLARPPPLSTARLDCAIMRRQRQANTRLQCSPSHIRDISALVEKMIEAEEQCNLCEHKPAMPSSPPPSDEDEGVDMEYTPSDPRANLRSLLPFYRAGERGDCTRVSKNVRMRKKIRIVKRPSK